MNAKQHTTNLAILDQLQVEAEARRRADLIREANEQRAEAALIPPTNERDIEIVRLTKLGLSAPKIRDRMGLAVSSHRVNTIARRHLGPMRKGNNSKAYQIAPSFMPYVKEALRRLGKDSTTCEICEDKPKRGCVVHHTKYEGVTVYDLMYICTSCNLARENKGLN